MGAANVGSGRGFVITELCVHMCVNFHNSCRLDESLSSWIYLGCMSSVLIQYTLCPDFWGGQAPPVKILGGGQWPPWLPRLIYSTGYFMLVIYSSTMIVFMFAPMSNNITQCLIWLSQTIYVVHGTKCINAKITFAQTAVR